MKKTILIAWLLILLCTISLLFWYNEWVYSLPAPVPQSYHTVSARQQLRLKISLADTTKPVFLYFFNPGCPCSRCNIPAFKKLAGQYGSQVNFAIIMLSNKYYTVKEIQEKFDLHTPVFFDAPTAVASGVYSTPQVALPECRRRLFYRGNYNAGRYCTNERTNFAAMAVRNLLGNNRHMVFTALALRAYGCSLPGCPK